MPHRLMGILATLAQGAAINGLFMSRPQSKSSEGDRPSR
jgi:hypothetical protein